MRPQKEGVEPTRKSKTACSRHPDLDQQIVRLVSHQGDATFGTILTGVQENFSVSRETIARRVARLLRFSQIVRLRHGHYVAGSSSRPPSTVLRVRNFSTTEVISIDGSARFQQEKEFLSLSGNCSRVVGRIDPAPSTRVRGVDVSGSHRVRVTTHRQGGTVTWAARFTPPLSPSPWVAHRLLLNWSLGPPIYAMQDGPDSSAPPTSGQFPRNFHGIGVRSNPEPGTIVETSKETILDLRVFFPRGFPRGPIHPKVITIGLASNLYPEARALAGLAKKSKGALGLNVLDGLVMMRVKNPLVDCFYGFAWEPPNADAYAGWIRSLRVNG